MYGPQLLARTLSIVSETPDQHGNHWQYHSRGDRHSKVACWGILFDLLQYCPTLVEHVRSGQVAFGINHEMRDFQQNRKKNLDLVICTPGTASSGKKTKKVGTFRDLAEKYRIVLPAEAAAALEALPVLPEAPVGAVRIALEAKAAMTAHSKARPRLFDELNSSHQTIHGAIDDALAVGFVMVNIASTFISPDMNKVELTGDNARVSKHKQPADAELVLAKVMELPRKGASQASGFDAVGIVVVDCANDGHTPVTIHTSKPAPQSGDIFHYDSMIHRLAELYRGRFG